MAVLENILTTVQTKIRALNLTDIPDANVIIQKVPSTRDFESANFPAVIIAPAGEPKFDINKGTNVRDQIDYPIGVFMIAADNQDQVANREKYFTWYEAILKEFRTPRLAGVDSIVNSYVTPGAMVEPGWFELGEYVAGLVLWLISWETR